MSKITIPKEAMKYATRPYSTTEEFHRNSDKFAEIMYKHYPHLSRHEIEKINLDITKRGINVNWMIEYQAKKRQEMLDVYRNYLDCKMRGNHKDLKKLENIYYKAYKKCYDDRVDELKEMGYNTKYAPNNMADLKNFISNQTNEQQSGYLVPLLVAIMGMVGFIYLCLP